jgi:hypothetical protein
VFFCGGGGCCWGGVGLLLWCFFFFAKTYLEYVSFKLFCVYKSKQFYNPNDLDLQAHCCGVFF